jgi:hypothetical protein
MDITYFNYVAQGLSRLANQYVGKPKLTARLTALLNGVQDLDICAVNMSVYRLLVDSGIGAWLDVCGRIVGIPRKLPNGTTLNDSDYRVLLRARIARNHAHGTIPELVAALTGLLDPQGHGDPIKVFDTGKMSVHVQVGRLVTADEKSILGITSGISKIPFGLLPKPSGVRMQLSDRAATGFFCFSTSKTAPMYPAIAGGQGFSNLSSPTGSWAKVVISHVHYRTYT